MNEEKTYAIRKTNMPLCCEIYDKENELLC